MNTSPVADHISITATSNNLEAIRKVIKDLGDDSAYFTATVTKERFTYKLHLSASPEPLS
jgi:hypothetical protein